MKHDRPADNSNSSISAPSEDSEGTFDGEPSPREADRLKIPRWAASVIVTLAMAGLIYLFQTDESQQTSAGLSTTNANLVPHLDQVENDIPTTFDRSQFLGTWVLDDGMVRRVISVNDDGTAEMKVNFNFFTSLRYGSELNLDLAWTLEDNVLQHTILDGSPEASKKTLISDFGNSAAYRVLSIQDGQMHLREFGDDPDDYVWKQVESE